MLQQDLHLTARINLYYDLFVPENAPGPAPLLVAVHGYGAHKRYMMREAQGIAPEDFAIVSLQGPHQHFRAVENGYRIGFGWLTDYRPAESVAVHQQFVLDILENLAAAGTIDPARVYLFGFSQACALNFRFAFTHPERVRGVAGVCGGIPGDLATNEAYRPTAADTFYLYNDDDEFYPLAKYEENAAALKAYLPSFEAKLYQARHEITDPMRADLRRWLAERR